MKMAAADIAKYPNFARYMRKQIDSLDSSTQIVNAVKKYSGATSKAKIRQGLRWGNDPEIELVSGLICAGVSAYGCYNWNNKIQIDEQLVIDFENGSPTKKKTSSGKSVYLVGVTLLHEFTHWADWQDGVDDPVPGDPSNEEGEAFEKHVYGKVLG
jgi:hypothetical protein